MNTKKITFVDKLIPVGEVARPEPRNAKTYEGLFGVYRDLWAAVSPFFVAIIPLQEDRR